MSFSCQSGLHSRQIPGVPVTPFRLCLHSPAGGNSWYLEFRRDTYQDGGFLLCLYLMKGRVVRQSRGLYQLIIIYCWCSVWKTSLRMPNHHCCATNSNSSSHKKKNLEKYSWMKEITFHSFPTFSKLADHQIRHHWGRTHLGCQPGDYLWSLHSFSGVCVGIDTNQLHDFHPSLLLYYGGQDKRNLLRNGG